MFQIKIEHYLFVQILNSFLNLTLNWHEGFKNKLKYNLYKYQDISILRSQFEDKHAPAVLIIQQLSGSKLDWINKTTATA